MNGYYGGGGCQPTPCSPSLPQQESVGSQMQNLETALFGAFTINIVNGRGVWSQTCTGSSPIPGYTQNAGEGYICFLLRVMNSIRQAPQTIAYATSIAQAQAIPTLNILGAGALLSIMNAVNPGQLSVYQYNTSASRPAASSPAIFYPTDNSQGYFTIVS